MLRISLIDGKPRHFHFKSLNVDAEVRGELLYIYIGINTECISLKGKQLSDIESIAKLITNVIEKRLETDIKNVLTVESE